MKALTVRQPFAGLIALGRKTIEFRSRPMPKTLLGRTVAIHAGKAWHPWVLPDGAVMEFVRLIEGLHPEVLNAGDVARMRPMFWQDPHTAEIHLVHPKCRERGKIIGAARFSACREAVEEDGHCPGWTPDAKFAWIMQDAVAFNMPTDATGRQGPWAVDREQFAHVCAEVMAAGGRFTSGDLVAETPDYAGFELVGVACPKHRLIAVALRAMSTRASVLASPPDEHWGTSGETMRMKCTRRQRHPGGNLQPLHAAPDGSGRLRCSGCGSVVAEPLPERQSPVCPRALMQFHMIANNAKAFGRGEFTEYERFYKGSSL